MRFKDHLLKIRVDVIAIAILIVVREELVIPATDVIFLLPFIDCVVHQIVR